MADERKQSDEQMRQEARVVSMTPEPATEGGLPPEAQGLIGHQLREEYRRVLTEPLPDKFAKLLDELARSEHQTDGTPETKPEKKK
jgi:hypothetical protein